MKVVVEITHTENVFFFLGDPPVLTSVAMFVPPCGVTLTHHCRISAPTTLISAILPPTGSRTMSARLRHRTHVCHLCCFWSQ